MREVYETKGKASGLTWEQFMGFLTGGTHTKRGMTLEEVANVAAFVASDKASGMTGTVVNLTLGALAD
ncbi:MAG TPA: SDR family oxidoreductase [Polyangiaceae bacterium]|jgi:enoyl-[acyl-carrier-protein] reductase (NADH)